MPQVIIVLSRYTWSWQDSKWAARMTLPMFLFPSVFMECSRRIHSMNLVIEYHRVHGLGGERVVHFLRFGLLFVLTLVSVLCLHQAC